MRWSRYLILPALLCSGVSFAVATNVERNDVRKPPTSVHQPLRVIVKLRTDDSTRAQAQSAEEPAVALARRARLALRATHSITARLRVLELDAGAGGESLDAMLARLRRDPEVDYAVPDERRFALALPDDPDYVNEWYLQDVEASAVDAQGAWDTTQGSKGVVIADIDTGVRYEHPDLGIAAAGGRLLPGYDFISLDQNGALTANDGDGRDADPSDPGDWVSASDLNQSFFQGCDQSDSSWHGTRVAGILGALTNNGTGVAGMTWRSYILPARVLGKCGGYDSDIIAGMLWAGGLHVDGVPDNPYPARIENLSLGSSGACPASYVDTVDQLTAIGVTIVVAAGNEGGPVGVPANCNGVVAVAGLRHAGTKVGFSNLGPQVVVSAPGGNCVNTGANQPCLFSIDTTFNTGTTVPVASGYTDQFNFNVGTSFSAPIVSGIVALMVAANGNLTPAIVSARLGEGAQPFPSDPNAPTCHVPANQNDVQADECNCTTSTCGAGMANARASVAAAERPIAAIAVTSAVAPGQDVTLDGGGSAAACGQSISAYAWSIASGTGTIASGADTATPTVIAPASGSYTLRLTVTDDAGLHDSADIVMRPTSTSTSAPADAQGVACPVAIALPEPSITVTGNPHVGEDLERPVTVALGIAPVTATDVTVTIAAAGTALVSDDAATLGTATVVLPDVTGTGTHTVFLQGLAFGTTTLTVSAPGYQTSTQTVNVDPSGFIINDSSFTVSASGANQNVVVEAVRLVRNTFDVADAEAVRPGVTVDVPVTSSSATVGVITNGPLAFDANAMTETALFDPRAAGTSTISVGTPSGFDTPSERVEVTATVTGSSSGDSGGGGGGAFDLSTLCLGFGAALRRLWTRRSLSAVLARE